MTPLHCKETVFFYGGEFIIVHVWPFLLHCASTKTESALITRSTVSFSCYFVFALNIVPYFVRVVVKRDARGMLCIYLGSTSEAIEI